eukprot:gene10491-biopygen3204
MANFPETALQCTTAQSNVVRSGAPRRTVQCNLVWPLQTELMARPDYTAPCGAVHHSALHCSALWCTAVRFPGSLP